MREAERIQRERNELLKEVSKEIGMDISFSDEALVREITDLAGEKLLQLVGKEVEASMKSLLS
tara:strand:- start:4104 stop:4292 length:189 start_codon:yes stop_codon:yes gene_type:complete